MSESEPKLPTYRLTTDAKNRSQVLQGLFQNIEELPLETEYDVILQTVSETRRDIQNRLTWRWHRQWAEHNHEPVGWAHGSTKLYWLLPLKLSSEHIKTRKRAEFEKAVIDHIAREEIKIGVAYDLIHSRDIPVRLFADWLSEYKRSAAIQGCILRSKQDLEDEALLRDYGTAA